VELVDTSVWAQKENPRIKPWFDEALVRGDLAICDQIALEILAGATSPTLYRDTRNDLRGVPWLRMDADDWRRALEVYDLLEERGTNTRRGVKIADLLIAACAERHELQIVHYDNDFETIASVTGQATRWVASPDSLGRC
jgi:predicted nucleic acid-binding protein